MKLYNSMSGKKEEFIPLEAGKVKMYSCGPTVYNYFHIGNARPFIIFDTLRRYFEYLGFEVNFVQNFTDVDDKMIKKAAEEGITVGELAKKFIGEYFKDAQGLGIKKATAHPLATENIDEIIKLISQLEEKGFAYNVDGDVYFATKKFIDYGKLSHQPLDELEAGARINIDERKNDPMDFALWKSKKEGEIFWNSPWGEGRPGWHIECSAMARKYLGETIDIHSGGQDLIFPHHENEIAQSEAACGKTFARYWIHNGYINVDNQKMSKSLNNSFTVRDVAGEYDYEVVRFFMLLAHYRNPINFAKDLMEQAKSALARIYSCVGHLNFMLESACETEFCEKEDFNEILSYKDDFINAMDDDLNTAGAIGVLFEMVRKINIKVEKDKTYSKEYLSAILNLLKELGGILGILSKEEKDEISPEMMALVNERSVARSEKNWKRADEIRDELKALGVVVEDTPQGVKVNYV